MTIDEAVRFLSEEAHLLYVRKVSDTEWVAIYPLMFTHAVVKGTVETADVGYEDRWCYHSYEDAKRALDEWDGTGEPSGWHRHPTTGRRRDEDGNEWLNL